MFLINLWVIAMEKLKNIIDYGLPSISLSWALIDIENVLSIILLILSLLNLLYKMIRDIYFAIKNKKYKDVGDVIENTIEDIEKLKEEI